MNMLYNLFSMVARPLTDWLYLRQTKRLIKLWKARKILFSTVNYFFLLINNTYLPFKVCFLCDKSFKFGKILIFNMLSSFQFIIPSFKHLTLFLSINSGNTIELEIYICRTYDTLSRNYKFFIKGECYF